MLLIKVVPYVLGMTPGVPGAPEPRMYPRSGYFLVTTMIILDDYVTFLLPKLKSVTKTITRLRAI